MSKKKMSKKKKSKSSAESKIVEALKVSYNMEVETVINYLANSVWLDGIRAKHIKDSLAAEVNDELLHAQTLANRIKTLDGCPPGSKDLKMDQTFLQPPKNPIDVLSVIKGVIAAEEGAIAQYQKIIDLCEGVDPVTQDMCTTLKGDEEQHRRLFRGFLHEAEHMKF